MDKNQPPPNQFPPHLAVSFEQESEQAKHGNQKHFTIVNKKVKGTTNTERPNKKNGRE